MDGLYHGTKQASRAFYNDSQSTTQFLYDGLPKDVKRIFDQNGSVFNLKKGAKDGQARRLRSLKNWKSKQPSKTVVGLILLWLVVLWWGETSVFSRHIQACQWHTWESWVSSNLVICACHIWMILTFYSKPAEAIPHHVVLLADPQLVDPHTYPGRPWPLSTLTILHTDKYLRRSFSSLQRLLNPDSAFFLGDLFDGGREWATGISQSPDKLLKKYGQKYWLKEYGRFSRIFCENWSTVPALKSETVRDRKFIASLPGNHDLGLGSGIRLSVRDRFTTYFGNLNRIDIIGNHTFVSVDSVSLSAKGQAELNPNELEKGQETNKQIWRTTEAFLSQAQDRKAQAVGRELRARAGQPENPLFNHAVLELNTSAVKQEAPSTFPKPTGDLPTILLTHVPLYRAPGTPCGPLRERWPPSRSSDDPEKAVQSDDANAISVSQGYQYQNVLQPDVSKQLIEMVGNVQYVFSGDDHDYCEVVHKDYTHQGEGIREITVKSMSWAMGVRKPGFLMLSLWNPIDQEGNSLLTKSMTAGGVGASTIQSHLCLLPDQLSIFIRYLQLLVLTLFTLVTRAIVIGLGLRVKRKKMVDELLPTAQPHFNYDDCQKRTRADSKSGSSSSNSSESIYANGLAARSAASRTRSVSPTNGYGISMQTIAAAPYSNESRPADSNGKTCFSDEKTEPIYQQGTSRRPRSRWKMVWDEMRQSTVQVASIALIWYLWLAYRS